FGVVHAREPELLHVAGDRGLGRVEPQLLQPRADLVLAVEPLAGDERQDRRLPPRLHEATPSAFANTSAASGTCGSSAISGGDIRTTDSPASFASTPRSSMASTTSCAMGSESSMPVRSPRPRTSLAPAETSRDR